jgi:hypothetical protein
MPVGDERLQDSLQAARSQFKLVCANLKINQPFEVAQQGADVSF